MSQGDSRQPFDFSGKGIAIRGRFSHSLYDLEDMLRERGARVYRSPNTKSDYFFVGSGVGYTKLEYARILGIPVLSGDKLDALLRGESVDLTDTLEFFETSISMVAPDSFDESLAEARQLLTKENSQETWEKLCSLVDTAPSESLDVLLEYVETHTQDWNDAFVIEHPEFFGEELSIEAPLAPDLRKQPSFWMGAIVAGRPDPKFRILRVLDLNHKNLVGSTLIQVVSNPQLCHIRTLLLSRNRPSLALFREWRDQRLFPQLKHLSLVGTFNLSPAMFQMFGQADYLTQLTHLDLAFSSLSKVTFDIFQAPAYETLTHLNLASSQVSLSSMNSGVLPALRFLDLSSFYQPEADLLQELAAKSFFPQLETLKLNHLRALRVGREAFEELFDRPLSLRRLELNDTSLEDEHLLPWLHGPGLRHLRALGLSRNPLTQRTIERLLEAPFASQLEELVWGETLDDSEGLRILAQAPQASNLRSLRVDTQILDIGILRDVLESPYLKKLEKFSFFGVYGDQRDEAFEMVDGMTHLSTDLQTQVRRCIQLLHRIN